MPFLIGFLGLPASGKTTTAAQVFGKMKSFGTLVEYVPEQARRFIAERRKDGGRVTLSQEDQVGIMTLQLEEEERFLINADDKEHTSIVLTDSCAFNSMLYMDQETLRSPEVIALVQRALNQYDLIFSCYPTSGPVPSDPYRLHSKEESKALEGKFASVLDFVEKQDVEVVSLIGILQTRFNDAFTVSMERAIKWR